MTQPSDADIARELVALFGQGRLAQAATLARSLTLRSPGNGFAWKALGAVLNGLGQGEAALAACRRAAELLPDDAEVHNNLGIAHNDLGQFGQAATCFRRSLQIRPDFVLAHSNLGSASDDLGLHAEALVSCDNALRIDPRYAQAHCNRGNALKGLGRLHEAVASYHRALELNPDFAQAHCNLGNACNDLREFDAAVRCYQRALALQPDYASAHNNLGTAWKELGQIDAALASYRQALELQPDFAQAHSNRGNALRDLGRLDEAVLAYGQALRLKPDFAMAHNNLGNALSELGQFEAAAQSYRQALLIEPDYAQSHCNLGTALWSLGRSDEAGQSYRRALQIKPDFVEPRVALAMLVLPIAPDSCAESAAAPAELERSLQDLRGWLGGIARRDAALQRSLCTSQPFYLAYRDGNHRALLSNYGDLIASAAAAPEPAARPAARDRLRLVIVSQHLRNHSVWHVIIRGLLTYLDRGRFEVIAYHTGQLEDQETALARSLVDGWRDTRSVGGADAWQKAMQADAPDAILYPELGMDPTALRLASTRLAPLQAASWGHPITTGMPDMDLYFSGELLEPPDADPHYRERLVRLPGTGCCTAPLDVVPEDLGDLSAELQRRSGPCFVIAQAPFKFDPADDASYARIAAAVPDSSFVLLRYPKFPWATDRVLARLEAAFRAAGLDPQRHLLVIPWLSSGKFHTLLQRCDVYLDCPSFSGYTTAWQAVHCGLPLVTQEGRYMRQRLAAGLLRRIGRVDGIAANADDYVAIATRLAGESRDRESWRLRRRALQEAAVQLDNDLRVVRAFEQAIFEGLRVASR